MSEQENIRIAEKFFQAINDHDLSQNSDHYAPDYLYEAPGVPGQFNQEQSQAYTQGFLDAFPDLHFEIKHKIAQGDYVVINWRATGIHTGPLTTPTGNQLPPTGKKAVVPGSTTYEFKGGKAVRSWVHWDMVTLLAQLGLMPGVEPSQPAQENIGTYRVVDGEKANGHWQVGVNAKGKPVLGLPPVNERMQWLPGQLVQVHLPEADVDGPTKFWVVEGKAYKGNKFNNPQVYVKAGDGELIEG